MAEGRQDAMAELYDRYAPMLLGLARKVLTSRDDAEEILQEALVHAWNQAHRYEPSRSSVSTWLVMITRSRAIDRLRSRRVGERTVAAAGREDPRGHASAEGSRRVLHGERRERVRQELARLPGEQRQVLELAFFRGMTQREIAEEHGIPLGTVKTRTLLAMKKLRTALRDEIRELL
jgi:RNA polymerase sigma-70 factor (ECF subfamily)